MYIFEKGVTSKLSMFFSICFPVIFFLTLYAIIILSYPEGMLSGVAHTAYIIWNIIFISSIIAIVILTIDSNTGVITTIKNLAIIRFNIIERLKLYSMMNSLFYSSIEYLTDDIMTRNKGRYLNLLSLVKYKSLLENLRKPEATTRVLEIADSYDHLRLRKFNNAQAYEATAAKTILALSGLLYVALRLLIGAFMTYFVFNKTFMAWQGNDLPFAMDVSVTKFDFIITQFLPYVVVIICFIFIHVKFLSRLLTRYALLLIGCISRIISLLIDFSFHFFEKYRSRRKVRDYLLCFAVVVNGLGSYF